MYCSYDLTQRMMMAGGKDCQRKSSRMRSHAGTNVDTASSEVRSLLYQVELQTNVHEDYAKISQLLRRPLHFQPGEGPSKGLLCDCEIFGKALYEVLTCRGWGRRRWWRRWGRRWSWSRTWPGTRCWSSSSPSSCTPAPTLCGILSSCLFPQLRELESKAFLYGVHEKSNIIKWKNEWMKNKGTNITHVGWDVLIFGSLFLEIFRVDRTLPGGW